MTIATLTIDPGECTGIAWGLDDNLVACDAATPGDELVLPATLNRATLEADCYVRRCVIELPRFYPPKAYGSPKRATAIGNSLIREAVTLGRWTERAIKLGFDVEEEYPRTWKGSVKKRTMCLRVIARMTRDERKMVSATLKRLGLAKSKTHNVLDAIGIFFWKVGRL